MKPAFTPGPWRYFKASHSIYGDTVDNPESVCFVYALRKGEDLEREANGHLIAAAPELLDDAKKLVNEVSGMMGAPELRALVGNTNFAVLQERWEKMRETIDKAEGWEA